MLTQGEVEEGILRVIDEMETLTEQYAADSNAEAEAENAYKRTKFTLLIRLATVAVMDDGKTKATAQWREAKAEELAAPEAETFRLAGAKARSTREALTTKRARLDALRSLAANIRGQV